MDGDVENDYFSEGRLRKIKLLRISQLNSANDNSILSPAGL